MKGPAPHGGSCDHAAMTSRRPLLRRPAVAAVAAAGSLLLPAAAQADCRQDIIRSWQDDGRVQEWFPQACYTGALRIAPIDVRTYANFGAVVRRAKARDARRPLTVRVTLPARSRVGRRPLLRVTVSRVVRNLRVQLVRGPRRRVVTTLVVRGTKAAKRVPLTRRGTYTLRVTRFWLLGQRRIAVTTSRPFVLRVRR